MGQKQATHTLINHCASNQSQNAKVRLILSPTPLHFMEVRQEV